MPPMNGVQAAAGSTVPDCRGERHVLNKRVSAKASNCRLPGTSFFCKIKASRCVIFYALLEKSAMHQIG